MILRNLITIILVALMLGCATAKQHSDIPLMSYDNDTRYGIKEVTGGFEIELYYSRYQFIPESSAVATACKSQLTAVAWKHSDDVKKEIEPINEQRIRISMGRNGFTCITSCRAYAPIFWKKPN